MKIHHNFTYVIFPTCNEIFLTNKKHMGSTLKAKVLSNLIHFYLFSLYISLILKLYRIFLWLTNYLFISPWLTMSWCTSESLHFNLVIYMFIFLSEILFSIISFFVFFGSSFVKRLLFFSWTCFIIVVVASWHFSICWTC